jgi:tRNA(fMet)-specific endonuclease VapC
MTYALDANVLICLTRLSPPVCAKRDAAVDRGDKLVIPRVAHCEVLRGFLCSRAPAKEKVYRTICSVLRIGNITAKIWERAAQVYAELYRKRLTVGDADILIAAFCLVNGYTLVTGNTKDFENIGGLLLENWVE